MSRCRTFVHAAIGAGASPAANHGSAPRRWVVAQVVTALLFVAGTSVAFADIWTYQLVGTKFVSSGRIEADGSPMAIVCSGVLGVCMPFDCNMCHTARIGGDRPSAFDESRHWREYLPQRAIAPPSGPPLAFGGLLVEQRDGRVTVLDRQRQPLFRLPPGAIILGDRSRSPAYIVWRGQQPPEVLR